MHSEETKRKIAASMKARPAATGWKRSPEDRAKISARTKGNKSFAGKKHTLETRRKQSEAHRGEKNPNFIDGESSQYPFEFYAIRESIIERDGCCQNPDCGITNEECMEQNGRSLSVHHIDEDEDNNEPDNLISYCQSCHMKVHETWWICK